MRHDNTEGESADSMLEEFVCEALYPVEGWNPPRISCRLHKRHSVVVDGIHAVVLAARLQNEFGDPPCLIRLADGVELRLDGFAKALRDRDGETAQLAFSLDVARSVAPVAVAQLLLEWADRRRVLKMSVNGVEVQPSKSFENAVAVCMCALVGS